MPVSTGSASSCPAAPATPAPQPQVQAPKGRAKAAGPKRKAGRGAGSAPSRSVLLADFRQPEPPPDEAEAARGRMTRTQKASHAAKARWAGHVAATSRSRASSNQPAQQQTCQQVHAIAQYRPPPEAPLQTVLGSEVAPMCLTASDYNGVIGIPAPMPNKPSLIDLERKVSGLELLVNLGSHR